MRRLIDKLLVIITISVVIIFSVTTFWVNLLSPKNIDIENGLFFGDKKAKVRVVVFEDFKCKYCKKYSNEIFPQIQKKYIDTNKINYVILPLAFIYGSKPLANAAIAIYELQKDQFFEFIKIISQKNAKIQTNQDLIKIASKLEGVDIEIFETFLDNEIFNTYLKDNLAYAKKIMPSFEVPAIYVNGNPIRIDKVINTIEENLNYKEFK